jgi:hypothetical protein
MPRETDSRSAAHDDQKGIRVRRQARSEERGVTMGAPDKITISARERQLQLLVIIARSLGDLAEKVSDLNTLTQQQNDLLRRILHKEHAP